MHAAFWFGIDTIEYDDSYFPSFWSSKEGSMLNLKESKQTRVGTAHYSLNGSNIFLILEFLIQNEGTYYERKDLNVY